MRYASVCSGIEAATVAWHPLGWEPAWFSEIDAFPSSILQHHYPEIPNYGDFTQILRNESHPARSASPDLLVGGTPCQAFSDAGLRRGFDDDRGNLTLEFCRLVGLLRPRWVVWENVPGVLSIDGGRAFGSIVGALAQLGYGWAYRVLDAQYFGVPQRRRRVFLVCHSGGDWRAPAAVLFEPEGVFRNTTKGAKTRKDTSRSVANGAGTGSGVISLQDVRGFDKKQNGCGYNQEGVSYTVDTHATQGVCIPTLKKVTAFHPLQDPIFSEDVSHAMGTGGSRGGATVAVVLDRASFDQGENTQLDSHIEKIEKTDPLVAIRYTLRRLTPIECERLQGFPDDYTHIPVNGKPVADGPRYKAIGNSMAVPVMNWIGSRIQKVNYRSPHEL